MPITFGGQAVPGTRAAHVAPRATQESIPEITAPSSSNDVLIFLFLVGQSLDARRELRDVVSQRREIDVDALNDPAFADHPRRPAMLALHEDRIEAERLAVIRLMEDNAALSRQWDAISPQDKNRYQLTTLIGECDPQMSCLQSLWCTDRGLSLLVPFPDHWSIPHDISYRVFDDTTGVRVYDIEEIMTNGQCPF